jgi:hypothetical protein
VKKLHLSKDVSLPLEVVTERLAFMGQSGSGKTYAAMRLAELMLDVGAQIVALDPVGPWWGLRAAADGKSAGYPVSVFGGIHGDVPLTPKAGALVADVVVERGVSAVIDVSDFTIGEMHEFVIAFSERFFDRKKRNPTPVHLFLEEAHTFIPQNLPPDPKAALMLNRVERIVRVGRNHGIGSTQISQMPQSVNKKALNQVSTLFAMRTMGKHERKAIAEWMADKATSEGQLDLDELLKKLETGEAWVASPHWLKVFEKTRISPKTTFDSSATPKFGVKLEPPKVLAAIDVEALRSAMVEVVQEAEKDDPAPLRKKIRELEAELRKNPTPAPPPKPIEVPAFSDSDRECLETVTANLKDLQQEYENGREAIAVMSRELAALRAVTERKQPAAPMPPAIVARAAQAARRSLPTPGPEGGLGGGERKMLEALALRHPTPLSRDQLGLLSGFTPSGGTFRTYLPRLRSRGLVVEDHRGITLTGDGLEEVGDQIASAPRSPEEVRAMWLASLDGGPRKMLEVLIGAYPDAMDKNALGAMSGYAAAGGTFRTYLPKLKRLGLVTQSGDEIRVSEELFQ